MAIKLAKPTFRAPGALRLAGGEKIQFVGIFRRLSKTEREEQAKRLRLTYFHARFGRDYASYPPEEAAEYARRELSVVEPITDAQLLDGILVDWELHDIEGQPIECTPENRTAVFEAYDELDSAFVIAYFDEMNRQKPEKNSGEPSSTISG